MASFTPDSKLVSYTNMAKCTYGKRKIPLKELNIIPHHMACTSLSAKKLCDNFATTRTNASATYTIGKDGMIAQCLPESYCPATSSNKTADMKAITFEIENSCGAPYWNISDKSLESLIAITTDICSRNGIDNLSYQAYTTQQIWGSTSLHNAFLKEQYARKNYVQFHQYFSRTACPGPYILSIAEIYTDEVNKRLRELNKDKQVFVYNGLDYSMVFDPIYYASLYPDVVNQIGADPMKLFDHFIRIGMKMLCVAKQTFNVHAYAYYNADLVTAFGSLCATNVEKYYEHYLTYGYEENRRTV